MQKICGLLGRASITCLLVLLVGTGTMIKAQERMTIQATAKGTSTQMGKNVGIKLIITQWSTDEDRETLKNAFLTGQNDGLVKALEKMKSVGRIQIPGTVGYDLAFVREVPTPTGRKIRFVTNRKIAFGEAYHNTQSKAYDLTAGKIDIDDKDPKKSAGTLLPATQLIVNSQGQLEWNLRKNPWQLTNIIDWNKGKEK